VRILAWDLETSPMLSWHWGRWQQNIRPEQTVHESRVLCFGARWVGTSKVIFKSEYDDGRLNMLETIHELLSEADAVMSWNGKRFDSKKIKTEFVREGMPPVPNYPELDLMVAVKRQFAFSSNKLDSVAQELGVGRKVSHEGFSLWLKVMEGDPKARALFKRYQAQDVNLLIDLYDRLLPWLPNHPNLALVDSIDRGCVKCGHTEFQRRGWAYTSASRYPRMSCKKCGAWQKASARDATTSLRAV
jgi:hypothetical protein